MFSAGTILAVCRLNLLLIYFPPDQLHFLHSIDWFSLVEDNCLKNSLKKTVNSFNLIVHCRDGAGCSLSEGQL